MIELKLLHNDLLWWWHDVQINILLTIWHMVLDLGRFDLGIDTLPFTKGIIFIQHLFLFGSAIAVCVKQTC